MEKLIEKFETIIDDEFNNRDEVLHLNRPATKIAEECKKVAITFAVWSILNNKFLTDQQLFNKFIEEEYGKQ
jgi:hypothetical protein